MGWERGQNGAGWEPGPGLPAAPARDPRLAGFAKDGEWDTCPPSAALAEALEGASGSGWGCAGASRDELVGLLRRWAALEAWAAAGRLGVLRALIRDDDQPLPGGSRHGDLPDGWSKSLTHEVAAALAVSVPTAENMMWLAWDLRVRLPGIAGLLADGTLACAKARAVDDAFQLLSDEDAARAEAMILAELPGKNYGQVKRLAEQAAVTVDPGAAARRREDAERNKARVTMFREDSGALALAGRDLPADETLAAHARVGARAQEYQESGVFPKDTRIDQLRAAAYVDLLNGTPAAARIASGALPGTGPADDAGTGRDHEADAVPEQSQHRSCPDDWDGDDPETGPDADESGGSRPDDGGPPSGPHGSGGTGGSKGSSRRPGAPAASGPAGNDVRAQLSAASPSPASSPERPPKLADLVIPLVTLLGLAERPGEGHGLGPIDPELCRALAVSAAASPFSRLCVTVTGPSGIAIGHGCAKLTRKSRKSPTDRTLVAALVGTRAALPARVNLTIPASRLAELTGHDPATGPPGQVPWTFTLDQDVGPPGGFGAWTLTVPGGRQLTVPLEPVPAFTCDHRHESHAYQPNDTLRHLVQVRDGECTFPPCSRHARETDFEHAVPYDQGGRTCACNAGARSRQCHRVKQSKGWLVTQPKPGWHQWETPAGRVYTQGPKRYPD